MLVMAEDGSVTGKQCLTENDLDPDSNCSVDDLPIPGLEEICNRLGLNMHTHMFPSMFEEEYDSILFNEDAESNEEDLVLPERKREDYIEAAKQCIAIEEELERMLEEDPDALEELERELLQNDPELLSEVVADVLAQNPDLIAELEEEIKAEDPELYKAIMEELEEGQSLADRSDILAEIVSIMLEDDPSLYEQLDGEFDELLQQIGEDVENNDNPAVGEL